MNILWISNIVLPDACKTLGLPYSVYGGWMHSLSKDLATSGQIKLAVATIYNCEELIKFEHDNISYYFIPLKSKSSNYQQEWQQIIEEFQPQLIHIHGTEYKYGMSLIDSYPNLNYVVSIQGMTSVYHRYFLHGMSYKNILLNITLRDLIKKNTLLQYRYDFFKQGAIEKEYIKKTSGVIGRTDWDYAHTKAISPQTPYYFCNESLRDEFYESTKWSLANCSRHSIFLSQAAYPIKGLHQVIKAAALLKTMYPDLLIQIAGHNITNTTTWKDRLKLTGYGKYIKTLIKKYQLESNITFLGALSADKMKKYYLSSHIFICPSSIENSPNSLGEAQILGTPCIASYVGGIPNMVTHDHDGLLYRFEEIEMLAQLIQQIFEHDSLTDKLSKNSIVTASARHDRLKNLKTLLDIYTTAVKN